MRYASTIGFEMKATSNINLHTQTNDVIINPIHLENLDSNQKLLGAKFPTTIVCIVFG